MESFVIYAERIVIAPKEDHVLPKSLVAHRVCWLFSSGLQVTGPLF